MSSTSAHPSFEAFMKYWLLSVMLSLILYGAAFTLGLACIDRLRRCADASQRRSNRWIMVYVLAMLAVCTASTVSSVVILVNAIFAPTEFQGDNRGVTGTVCIVLSNWGADGFLLWRCFLLYQGIARERRRLLSATLIVMGLMLFGAGVTCLSMALNYDTVANLTIFAVTCTSLFVNLAITTLICARIIYFIGTIKSMLDRSHWSRYKHIISIMLESAALIVVFGLAYVVLTLALPIEGRFPMESLSALVPMTSITHIYVIAPCLIIYRVSGGESWTPQSVSTHNIEIESRRTSQRQSVLLFNKAEPTSLNEEAHEVDFDVELQHGGDAR